MQFGLDLRNLSIVFLSQLSQALRRFSSDDGRFALQLEGLESLLQTLDRLSQRVAPAILYGPAAQRHIDGVLAQQDLLRDVSEGSVYRRQLVWFVVAGVVVAPPVADESCRPVTVTAPRVSHKLPKKCSGLDRCPRLD